HALVALVHERAQGAEEPVEAVGVEPRQRHVGHEVEVADVVEGVVRVLDNIPAPNPDWNSDAPDSASSNAPYRLYNIGHNQPVGLMHFIETLEKNLGKKAKLNMLPLQQGDVPVTYADVDDLIRDVGYKPETSIETGIARFVEWYKDYYKT
ncbi:MAG: hypothetical protein ACLGGU_00385, partial [Gammaproteobacteria bacterium]